MARDQFALVDRSHRLDNRVRIGGIHHIAVRACFDSRFDGRRIIECRENENTYRQSPRRAAHGRLDAAAFRHLYVEHNHFRPILHDEIVGLSAILSFGNDRHITSFGQKMPDAMAYNAMIVGKHNVNQSLIVSTQACIRN